MTPDMDSEHDRDIAYLGEAQMPRAVVLSDRRYCNCCRQYREGVRFMCGPCTRDETDGCLSCEWRRTR